MNSRCFKLNHAYSISRLIRQMFLELNSKRPYQRSGKEKESWCPVFPSSTKREIRHFHVAVVQQQLRNVEKSVMHVQSCCFANLNLLLFCRSRWRRRRRCLSSLPEYLRKTLFFTKLINSQLATNLVILSSFFCTAYKTPYLFKFSHGFLQICNSLIQLL